MRPYYEHDGISIYHADCRGLLADLPTPGLLVLDPPFQLWEEVPYVEAGTTIAFTNWQHRRTTEDLLGTPRTEAIWHFLDGRWVSHQLPITTHETILVYGELNDVYLGEEQDQKPQRIAPHRHLERIKTPRTTYIPRERRALNSVLHFPQNSGTEELGRWSKPLGLMRNLIEWTATGGLILDPYMGGGTTLRVAKDLGMEAIGIEIEESYCEIAARRLGQEAMVI